MEDITNKLDSLYGNGKYYFQQDNAPIHNSKSTKEFFERKKIQLIEWPAKSPDLNIIENVWHMLANMVYENKQYSNKEELWESIKEAADVISYQKVDQVMNLYKST